MIKWYKFNNFHSFLDETFVDFTSGVKSSYSDIDFQLDKNTKISKVSAILGANGSGKSNLMKP
ncbi:helicase HerA domain-containing protein, partial [Aeromonas jandaei]|uniref:helicase HerA domain-containing protein n=1 Tax=Aeromonas jandaei TaxID=650 RepID=UPI002AA0B5BA